MVQRYLGIQVRDADEQITQHDVVRYSDYAALERTVGEMRLLLEEWQTVSHGFCFPNRCDLCRRTDALLAPKQAEEPSGQQ
jgi:hypothetical protein